MNWQWYLQYRRLEKIILEAVMITCWLKELEGLLREESMDLAAPNHPLGLPDYVRFSPNDREVIHMLKRFIRKEHMTNCAVNFLVEADLKDTIADNVWTIEKYPYFEEDEYWFFLHRKPAGDDKVNVDRRLGNLGTWKARGRSTKIYIAGQLVGIKQKYELLIGKLKTGWSQFEYIRFSNKFEKSCVTHLIFARTPEVHYPSDISEEDAEEEAEEEAADEFNEQQGQSSVQEQAQHNATDEVNPHEEEQNEQHGQSSVQEQAQHNANLEEEVTDEVDPHEEEQNGLQEHAQQNSILGGLENELMDEGDGDGSEDWTRFLSTDMPELFPANEGTGTSSERH